MLKITSIEIKDKNLEQNGKKIQVENQNKKESILKNCKNHMKGQKIAKSKKCIQAKKVETFRAKNLGIQSGFYFISGAKRAFTKLR